MYIVSKIPTSNQEYELYHLDTKTEVHKSFEPYFTKFDAVATLVQHSANTVQNKTYLMGLNPQKEQ